MLQSVILIHFNSETLQRSFSMTSRTSVYSLQSILPSFLNKTQKYLVFGTSKSQAEGDKNKKQKNKKKEIKQTDNETRVGFCCSAI